MSQQQSETLPCPGCRKTFTSDNALKTHMRMTHANPEWIAARETKRERALAKQATLPPPTCPRCGELARIDHTQFGPRATCCGMHSWGLKPLKDTDPNAPV